MGNANISTNIGDSFQWLISLGGGGNFCLDTPITNSCSGGHGDFRLELPELDDATTLGLGFGFSQYNEVGKLFPEAETDISGSYTNNEQWKFGLRVGYLSRMPKVMTDDGRPWLFTRSISRTLLDIGWMSNSSESRNVGGVEYGGNSDEWKTLTLSKETGFGLELWMSKDWSAIIEAGFMLSALQPFADDKETEEWPWSAQSIGFFFRLNLAYGDYGSKVTKSKDLTGLQIGRHFYQETFNIFYSWILYENFSKPQAEGQALVGDVLGGSGGGGLGGGSMWIIPSLQTLSTFLGAGGNAAPITYHIKAPSLGWQIPGLALELGKAIGYTAAGSGGDAADSGLLTAGISSFNNLLTIGGYELGIPEKYLFLLPFILGGLEVSISAALEYDSPSKPSLMSAGISSAVGWTQSPERGREEFISSTKILYSPASYVWGNISGLAGTLKYRHHFEESILFAGMGIVSPAAYIANLGNLGINSVVDYDQENPYEDADTPNFIMSTLGVEQNFDLGAVYFNLGAGFSFVQQIDAESAKGGAGIMGSALFGIWINSEKSSSILLGADMLGFLTDGDGGFMIAPVIGGSW